ncbi:MAG: Gfo/Idh/MocA family oxidoreductase [Phenylobacterium sp.]
MKTFDKNNKMKVLMVGAGSIGQKEIKELKKHPLVQIVGLVETDEKRRSAMAPFVPKTYTDLEKGIIESNPDLVRIATPPQTHYKLTMTALRAKKDVYIEKQETLRVDEMREIVELSRKMECRVYVRRNAIYTAVYQETWTKMKEIGEVRHVHWIEPREKYSYWSEYKQKWLRDLPGGIISEHLPHALYTVRWFLGGEPEVDDVIHNGEEFHASLKLGNKRGEITYTKPCDLPSLLVIVGSEGTIFMNHSSYRVFKPRGFEDSRTLEWRTVKANLYDLFGSIGNFMRLVGHFFVRELELDPRSVYSKSDNYRQFTDIARGGDTGGKFSIDGEEGIRNVELFEKIWRKAGEIK